MRQSVAVGVPIVACLVAWSAPAGAQPASPGYVQGLGGATVGRGADLAAAAAAGVRISRRLHVTIEGGHMRDVRPPALDAELRALGSRVRSEVAAQFGQEMPVEFESRAPAWYLVTGLRLQLPAAGRLHPYGEAGAGLARVDPRVRLEVNGEDLSRELRPLLRAASPASDALVSVGGGVRFDLRGPLAVDADYRQLRILGDEPVNLGRITAALVYRF